MTTPLATVANSIIEFILSLLRDPAALEALKQDPETTLAKNKLSDVCADDVRAVAPVIYDRADVAPKVNPPSPPSNHNDVVNEITRITTNWTMIDNRATIVDQSVNQNIWTEGGDVTQVFDQTAGVASGDDSIAAGDDVTTTGAPPDDAAEDDTDPLVAGLIDDAVADAEAGTTDAEPDLEELAEEAPEPLEDAATPPVEQLDAAVDAGVPQEAADVVETVAQAPVEPAAAAEVDEAVWSEPTEPAIVEEVPYVDEMSEEQ
ncbi:IniB N-terminal domain-containing protein [Microbacterium allomyrinae]|jgi:hypothetical protein|uniref:IniB N-terminal domain-containing protein n=1 Tax=Microbacterium allomyrinae TaxID=2830666 RepID=A0A9X1LXU6_9MICO|nr:IniB N-terminal domain-containing protein [Microbacterium allomyrinae]MCC2034099.1 IniB N-terminal domain-containing protein [Microbacterium allomyrinae]